MDTKNTIAVALVAIIGCQLMGCTTKLSVSGDKKPLQIKSAGIVNSYAACNGFRPYDGTIIEAGIFNSSDRWGNLASLDVWPLGGIGLSAVGARVKILPFEVGVGILGCDPRPEYYWKEKHHKEATKKEDHEES